MKIRVITAKVPSVLRKNLTASSLLSSIKSCRGSKMNR